MGPIGPEIRPFLPCTEKTWYFILSLTTVFEFAYRAQCYTEIRILLFSRVARLIFGPLRLVLVLNHEYWFKISPSLAENWRGGENWAGYPM